MNSNVRRPLRQLLGLVVGIIGLLVAWLVALVTEPYLVALSVGSASAEALNAATRTWGNSNVWLASVVAACAWLLLVGFGATRLGAPASKVVPGALLVLLVGYFFFAQFPATRSPLRIALWSIAPPVSLLLGAWLALRGRTAA